MKDTEAEVTMKKQLAIIVLSLISDNALSVPVSNNLQLGFLL